MREHVLELRVLRKQVDRRHDVAAVHRAEEHGRSVCKPFGSMNDTLSPGATPRAAQQRRERDRTCARSVA